MINKDFQYRCELGNHLAKSQTLVMRAFKAGVVGTFNSVKLVDDVFACLTAAKSELRYPIVEGTELCIHLLSDRYRHEAKSETEQQHIINIERAMHEVISSSIDRLAALHQQSENEYFFQTSYAA
jgi:hypothetical protein